MYVRVHQSGYKTLPEVPLGKSAVVKFLTRFLRILQFAGKIYSSVPKYTKLLGGLILRRTALLLAIVLTLSALVAAVEITAWVTYGGIMGVNTR